MKKFWVAVVAISGFATMPSIAQLLPKVEKIVFDSDRNGNDVEVYIMNTDGTKVKNLTNDPSYDAYPSICPDGKTIVFTSTRPVVYGKRNIYTMKTDGTGVKNISESPDNDDWMAKCGPPAAPGGRNRVVFVRDLNWPNGQHEIFVMNDDGTNVRQLTNDPAADLYPSWCGGKLILFASLRPLGGNGGFDIWSVTPDGLQLKNFYGTGHDEVAPSCSPDKSQLLFTRIYFNGPGYSDIFRVKVSGSGEVNLTNTAGYDHFPAWSLDGRKVVFEAPASTNDPYPKLWVMDAEDGANLRLLTTVPLVDDEHPEWGWIYGIAGPQQEP